MPKLVAIGDSLTQGFQSGAISKTYQSYPALIAQSMGLDFVNGFRVPIFRGSGLPLNIERFLRSIDQQLDADIDTGEWLFEFPFLLDEFVNDVETLYEVGAGSRPANYGGVYHNLAVWGFRVIDSFKVDSAYCEKQIDRDEGWFQDDTLGLPSASRYRTARHVLNPRWRDDRKNWTQIHNLKYLNDDEGDVENLILFFGANDCLGTVVDLEVKDMEGKNVSNDPEERRKYNLTSKAVFEADYRKMVEQVLAAISPNTKVFVATVPHVTIPPITQGIPPYDDKYFEHYGRFFTNEDNFHRWFNKHLTQDKVRDIDERIDAFNKVIETVVAEQQANGGHWHLVDICGLLDKLAVKRNNMTSTPDQPLKEFYEEQGRPDHPLLKLDPIPSVLRFCTHEDGQRCGGGFFSLDCVHPSTIGYGLVAEEFLREMQVAGVLEADPARLNWKRIINQDTLIQQPLALWDDIVEAAEHHDTLWELILSIM